MMTKFVLFLLVAGCILTTGCAEGPLWQTGHFVPWAKNQWEEENKTAATLQSRQRELDQMVQQASSVSQIEQTANRLGEISSRDPVLLIRLHAVSLLGQINHPTAMKHLKTATTDADSRIRIAAIHALSQMSADIAIPQLQEVIGSDTDVDVRLSATKALGNFSEPSAAAALSIALADNNPAIQYRAIESLKTITGQKLGTDVVAWQNYLGNLDRASTANSSHSINPPTLR